VKQWNSCFLATATQSIRRGLMFLLLLLLWGLFFVVVTLVVLVVVGGGGGLSRLSDAFLGLERQATHALCRTCSFLRALSTL